MTLPPVILVSNLQNINQLILPHVHQPPVTFCNKNGSVNKTAGHFRKYASSVSKSCFVCGSGTYLIKDSDFFEKQITNRTVGFRVGPAVRPQLVPTGKLKLKPVPTGKPKVKRVPTGKPQVSTPVPTG
nr:hypothetical protein [Tanacetum cinerariifolium]